MNKTSQRKTPLKIEEENKLLFRLEENIPKSQQERKKYVGDIAYFFSSIFQTKLQHFIGEQLLDLSIRGRSKEQDDMIRANIYCFGLIEKWMKEKTSEHIGNVTNIRNSLDDDGKFSDTLKDKYPN